MDEVEKLLKKSLAKAKKSKYCINCQYSYFNPGGYDGHCKYVKDVGTKYLHLKPITTFDVCEHWEKKEIKE